MTTIDPRFATTLIRLMREAGTTQRTLSARAKVSTSYLSEVVNGIKMPTLKVADALDKALSGDGQLVELIAFGVAGDDHDRMASAVVNPAKVGAEAIAAFDRALSAQRTLDDLLGSQLMLGSAGAQMNTIVGMVRTVVGPQRSALMRSAAGWAQFVGWLNTSTGRWDDARMWFARCVEWATEADDPDMVATAQSYQAHVAWLNLVPACTLGLSLAALRNPAVYPGQRAYDAYQATRAYAATGHLAEAERMLGNADALADEANGWSGELPAHQYYRAPWFWALERGLARLYMARQSERCGETAVADLRAGLAGIPDDMRGADWAAEYMTHLATGLMRLRELDEASVLLERAGIIAEQTHSKRVALFVKGRERRLLQLRPA